MFGPIQGSASYGQDDQWAAAVTLGGDYGDWSGWTLGNFTLLAAASVYNTDDDNVDYSYAASGSALHDPTGLSLTLSTGGQKLDEGDDPTNLYAKIGWDTQSGHSARPGSASTIPRARTSAARAPRANPTASRRCSGSSNMGSTSTASFAGTASTTAATPT